MDPRLTEKHPLKRYLGGCLAGFLAGHVLNFGIVQYVQATLHNPGLAGLSLFVAFGTPLLLGLHAGAVCDRRPSIYIVRLMQLGFALGALILIGLSFLSPVPHIQIPGVLLAAVFIGIGWSYVSPARLVYLAQLVPQNKLRSSMIVFNVFSTIGFGLAPLLIGVMFKFGGWSATFGSAIALLIFAELSFVILPVLRPEQHEHSFRHWWPSAKDAIKKIVRTPVLLQLLVVTMVVHILLGPIQVIMPKLAVAQWGLGAIGRGAFLSTLAPLLIAGGMIALRVRESVWAGRWMLAACIISGTAMMCVSFAPNLWVAVPLFLVFGVCGGVAVALLAALLQATCNQELRGRVMSLYSIGTQFFPAFGGLLSGLVMLKLEPASALVVIAGGVSLLFVLLLPLLRAVRRPIHTVEG